MIKEIKLKYPTTYNGEEYLSITGRLTSFYFEKLDGFGMPQVRQEVRMAGNMDGMVKGNSLYGGRVLSIEGGLHCATRNELLTLRSQLEYALSLGNVGNRGARSMRIILENGEELSVDVFLYSDPDFAYNKGERHFGSFRFDLGCESEIFTSINEHSEIIPIYNSLFGFPLPFPIPFTLGNLTNTLPIPVNSGNKEANTIFQFTAQVTNPSVKNTATGLGFTVTETINTGDEMLVDSENKSVLLKRVGELSYTNITNKFIGKWIVLIPGQNKIIFSGNNINSETNLTIKWFNSYIGI